MGAPPRVRLLDDLPRIDAVPEPRQRDPARHAGRHVHVEERLRRERGDERPHREEARDRRRAVEIAAVDQRDFVQPTHLVAQALVPEPFGHHAEQPRDDLCSQRPRQQGVVAGDSVGPVPVVATKELVPAVAA